MSPSKRRQERHLNAKENSHASKAKRLIKQKKINRAYWKKRNNEQ